MRTVKSPPHSGTLMLPSQTFDCPSPRRIPKGVQEIVFGKAGNSEA
jgi:hypothetical protein